MLLVWNQLLRSQGQGDWAFNNQVFSVAPHPGSASVPSVGLCGRREPLLLDDVSPELSFSNRSLGEDERNADVLSFPGR